METAAFRTAWLHPAALFLFCNLAVSFSDQSSPDQPTPWYSECHQTKEGLNCSSLALGTFNGDVPDFVTTLDLSENSLKGDEVLPYGENLRVLSLRNNQLAGVKNWRIEDKMPKLEELDLSGNALTSFPPHLSQHLRKLDLGRNALESVSDVIFNGEIEELFLNENRILGELDLCSDSPSSSENCGSAGRLTQLDLSKNAISAIKNSGFTGLVGLKVLSLASNNLKSLSKLTFHGLRNLDFLDLSDNELSSVDDQSFEGLKNLKFLYLRGNFLAMIPSKLPLLEWFDVSYNNIVGVNETMKTSLYPIEMVNLGHNPFNCDCHLLWLKEWYDRREYILDYSVDIPPDEYVPSCASPPHLAGDHWDVLADQVFVCEQEEKAKPPQKATPSSNTHNYHGRLDPGMISDYEKYVAAYDLHVQVRSIHSDMVKLEWRAPSHFTNLLIQYFKAEEEEETTLFAQVQATQGHHVLKNLDPESSYKICVLPKAEALAPLSDINDCLTVYTLPGEGGDGGHAGGQSWFQIDHTLESRFKMIFACFGVAFVIVAFGVLFTECVLRICSERLKEHAE